MKNIKKLLLIIIIILSAMMFVYLLHLNMLYQQSQSLINERIECELTGGVIKSVGGESIRPQRICVLLTTDVGIPCTDSSQCQGYCSPTRDWDRFSDENIGVCSKTERYSHCNMWLSNGTAKGYGIACD